MIVLWNAPKIWRLTKKVWNRDKIKKYLTFALEQIQKYTQEMAKAINEQRELMKSAKPDKQKLIEVNEVIAFCRNMFVYFNDAVNQLLNGDIPVGFESA